MATDKKCLIFQLGTNNWQTEEEPAPGSGILHEAHHVTFNMMKDTASYSVYPSSVHSENPARTKCKVVKLPHKIPICESVSPTSDKKWHTMSGAEVETYLGRLEDLCYEYMKEAEEAEGCDVTFAIAHHTFINPLIMMRVNERRVREGKAPTPVVSFCHGTALKMYASEKKGEPGYDLRFLPWIEKLGVFAEGPLGVQVVVAISEENQVAFAEIFPDFPDERLFVSLNGYDPMVFHPEEKTVPELLANFKTIKVTADSGESAPKSDCAGGEGSVKAGIKGPPIPAEKYSKMVLFVGKFANWKRLDAVLMAAQAWEKTDPEIMTVIAGTGGAKDVKKYHQLAFEKLGLENTFFVGSQSQVNLRKLCSAANVGCFPSLDEPFGMVFIECMACGTPVIGAASGGPLNFVTDDVGFLVPESKDLETLAQSVGQAVMQALQEDWKLAKREACLKLCENFTMEKQCAQIKDRVLKLISEPRGTASTEERTRVRAYYKYLNTGVKDEIKNYYEAEAEEKKVLGG